MVQFQKDTIIGDVLVAAPECAPFFQSIGMHCLGCAMASGETIEEACQVHDVDADKFIEALNNFLASQA